MLAFSHNFSRFGKFSREENGMDIIHQERMARTAVNIVLSVKFNTVQLDRLSDFEWAQSIGISLFYVLYTKLL